MTTVKMLLDISGIVTASNNIDVSLDGTLEAFSLMVSMSINATPATGDGIQSELSFLSSSNIGSGHDSRGILGEVTSQMLVGLANSHILPSVPFIFANGLDIKVNAGERMFIHGVASQADVAGRAIAMLYIRDRGDKTAPRRR